VAKATRNASTRAAPDRALGLQDWVDPARRNLDLPPIRALQATDLLLEGSWRGASMACLEQHARFLFPAGVGKLAGILLCLRGGAHLLCGSLQADWGSVPRVRIDSRRPGTERS
jgi:hypothetical protein